MDQLEDDDPASKVGNRSKTRTSRQEISPLVKSDYINTSLNRSSSGVLTAEKAGGQPALQCFPQAYIPDDNKHPSICYFPAVHQALGDLVECSEGAASQYYTCFDIIISMIAIACHASFSRKSDPSHRE